MNLDDLSYLILPAVIGLGIVGVVMKTRTHAMKRVKAVEPNLRLAAHHIKHGIFMLPAEEATEITGAAQMLDERRGYMLPMRTAEHILHVCARYGLLPPDHSEIEKIDPTTYDF